GVSLVFSFLLTSHRPVRPLFPYTTLFRSVIEASASKVPTKTFGSNENLSRQRMEEARKRLVDAIKARGHNADLLRLEAVNHKVRSEEHTSELQSRENLVCRLLLEKKKQKA